MRVFTASSTSSSRGEGANKDYKIGLKSRSLTLDEAYEKITDVQKRKMKNQRAAIIREGTATVDARRLVEQWFPEINADLTTHVSGYCRERCQEQMGSSGNYTVRSVLEPGILPEEVSHGSSLDVDGLAPAPDVDPETLDLTSFLRQFEQEELGERDPYRRCCIASFLQEHPSIESFRIVQVENCKYGAVQYILFYDPVTVEGGSQVFKHFHCTCGEPVTGGYPCRHFFAAHRHLRWAGFHLHMVNSRWHLHKINDATVHCYGTAEAGGSTIVVPAPQLDDRTTKMHCPALDKTLDIPVDQYREAKRTYGMLWGLARSTASLLCVDCGSVQLDECEEVMEVLKRVSDKVRKRQQVDACPPEDRALLEAKHGVANVKDVYRPDKRQRAFRKCGICGKTGHNRATCPERQEENVPPEPEPEMAART